MSTARLKLLSSALVLAALAAVPSAGWAKGGGGVVGGGGGGGGGKLGLVIVEGPITAIDPTGGSISISGIKILVPAGTPISTPTRQGLSLTDLSQAKLPAWSQQGFIGGHAVAQGSSVGGQMTAANVFTDAAENPVTAEVTSTAPLKIEGLLVQQLPATGPMPGAPPQNIYGFEIVPTSIPPATLATAQGYYGNDQVLYYYSFQSNLGQLVHPGVPEVSVTRARCTAGQLQVNGGAHSPSAGTVTVEVPVAGGWSPVGTAPLVDVGLTAAQGGPIGQYKFQTTVSACPTQVMTMFGSVSAVGVVLLK